MELPTAYIEEVHELIKPLLKGFGAIRIKAVEQIVGKANRIAQVVHQARPFVAALYAALTAGKHADQHRLREAPPGCMAKRRLLAGSRWIAALLRGAADAPFPLLREVYSTPPPRAVVEGARIEFDASPWGGGAILYLQNTPCAYFATRWTEDDAPQLNVVPGLPTYQTFWEFATLMLALITWGGSYTSPRQTIAVLGDNTAALSNALRLRGLGPLQAIAREIAWRQAIFRWSYEVGHLPSENNRAADALSRLHAPERSQIPPELRQATEILPPALADMWQVHSPC